MTRTVLQFEHNSSNSSSHRSIVILVIKYLIDMKRISLSDMT